MKALTGTLFSLYFSFFAFSGFLSNHLVAGKKYTPTDSILLSCGSSVDAVDTDGRKWQGDAASKYIVSSENTVPARASYQDASLPSTVPYMSARIFTSNATYSFPVTGNRHWIRLHFYPVSYSSLNASDSFFSITSGSFTLLRNFSAAITAQALTQAYIIREFSMSSSNGSLNLTFSPSTEHKSAYAFVNGIEIVSMPEIFEEPATLVGFATQSIEPGSSILQTMFRLNVGGQYISASQDSNLSRIWYDDSPYLYGAGIGITFAAEKNLKVRYTDSLPEYIAPVDVYGTARSMGPDPKINHNFNLTWVFQVDPNFMYMVRLHFCELQLSRINQRVFDVFVNNRTAQASADVLAWTGSKGIPIYKDYAAYVSGQKGEEDTRLWVALHPSAATQPEFYDSILNGLEVFKLNDTAGNLAGPNPIPPPMIPTPQFEEQTVGRSNSNRRANVIGGTAGGAAAMGLMFVICFAVYRQKKREFGSDKTNSGWLPIYGNSNSHTMGSKVSTISGRSTTSSHVSQLAANLCRHFSFQEIKQGTKNFDESLVLGVGGFGKVYRGEIDGGTKVAIKRANPSSEQGVHEFQTEIEMLSKLRHRHLVSLIGYCEENDEMILVYDYMAHGTVREHLYKSNKPPLSWKQRLEICIGSARGLHYLHTGAKYPIIHRDVKTTNILLDEKLVAKVSDFGLSKTGPNMNQSHVSTVVKGSFGYLDPEYFRRQQLTNKSDVYSFGVVLFEVLCARPALNPSLPKEQVSLADWALHCQRKGILEDIIDPQLKGKVSPECLKKFSETAEKCLSDHGADRPTMGDVLWNLEFALQLQENPAMAEKDPGNGDSGSNAGSTYAHSVNESEVSTNLDLNTSAVFSQLINPKGR